jgi:PAS domain S-box-containing protein
MFKRKSKEEHQLMRLNKFGAIDLLNATSSAMAILNTDGKVLISNDEFKKFFVSNAAKREINALIGDNENFLEQNILELLKGHQQNFSHSIVDNQGVNVSIKFKVLGKQSKGVFYACSICKEHHSDSGYLLPQLLNTIPIIVFIKDENCRYIFANNWLAKLHGVKLAEELLGKNDFDLYPVSFAQSYFDDEQLILQTGEQIINKEEKIVINGVAQWFLTTKIPFCDSAGNIRGIMGVSRDVTNSVEKTKAYEIAIEKAERDDLLKSTFIANLSHEIRTPLNSIIGFSQFLKQKKHTEEKRDKYINTIYENGKQLLMLVNGLIDISMVESNQLVVNLSLFRVNPIIEQLKADFKYQVEKMGLSILVSSYLDLSDGEDKIYCDSFLLTKILNRLLSNAIKFTRSGTVEVGYCMKMDTIEFFVKDSGIGMEEEVQKEIFNRFRQVDESATRNYGGTGLGLALCKGLVDLLGGTIWVESQKNEGASFYFTLPIKNILK